MPETHEVLLHPFFYTILIKECTFPREGTTKASLVEKAYPKIYPVAKDLGVGFTRRATQILIESAVKLGLLHKNLHWNARGHVINTLAHSLQAIGLPDGIAYLKYYLDTDGVAMIHLVRKMVEKEKNGFIDRSSFLNERGWEETVKALVQEYLALPLEPSQKINLRRFMRKAEKGYAPHTREHRFNPRAEMLVDLGILERKNNNRVSYGFISRDSVRLMHLFLELFSDANSLETILSEKGDFFHRAARLFAVGDGEVETKRDFDLLQKAIVKAYEQVRDDTFRLASIEAISDIVCIELLIDSGLICEWRDVKQVLQTMRSEAERDVRYHVDDWGKITFITITSRYVKSLTV